MARFWTLMSEVHPDALMYPRYHKMTDGVCGNGVGNVGAECEMTQLHLA